MTPSDCEAAGQRVARARRRRGLSQAVLAGLVGRSASWLSQVERGKRSVDSHSVLLRLTEVLRVDLEELTGSADRNETGRPAHPAAPLIEQAMMGYGGRSLSHADRTSCLRASRSCERYAPWPSAAGSRWLPLLLSRCCQPLVLFPISEVSPAP
jgi:transcriptional regulator with XRE-family HTH domain